MSCNSFYFFYHILVIYSLSILMTSDSIVSQLQSKALLKRFEQAGLKHMWLFGYGEENALREDSDIDLLYEEDPTLIQDDRGVR